MKNWLIYIGIILIVYGIILNLREEVIAIYNKTFKLGYMTIEKNEYFREYDFLYLQNTVDFEPQNIQEIMNIFYTVINSGQETFSFVCPEEYTTCTEDVKKIANSQTKLSHINNFVHPYNGFKHIETQYTSLGEVTITINKLYTEAEISEINAKIDEISSLITYNNFTDTEKIKAAHDYIINNSKYDVDRSDQNIIKYKSDTAYGPLLQNYGICGGYSDAMQLFLEKFGIKNYKVSSETHIWNAVYLDGAWYHLDLTWDDPVTSTATDILDDEFFLISTNDLLAKDLEDHYFDQNVYLEFKLA